MPVIWGMGANISLHLKWNNYCKERCKFVIRYVHTILTLWKLTVTINIWAEIKCDAKNIVRWRILVDALCSTAEWWDYWLIDWLINIWKWHFTGDLHHNHWHHHTLPLDLAKQVITCCNQFLRTATIHCENYNFKSGMPAQYVSNTLAFSGSPSWQYLLLKVQISRGQVTHMHLQAVGCSCRATWRPKCKTHPHIIWITTAKSAMYWSHP